jgi:tRNA-splicing ligase RtcB
MCPLPKEAEHLAWLGLDTAEGQEYWLAMNLAGDYASACHHEIHRKMAVALGTQPLAMVENHHNFAWKEIVDGKELIVHRKGATPAARGVLGIIPGSMTAPGFIVRGKGHEKAVFSASHGAGRRLSRTQAMKTITRAELKQVLSDYGITLSGGGLDEAPQAYKDIHSVMAAQTDLIEVVGAFYPRVVRMDG